MESRSFALNPYPTPSMFSLITSLCPPSLQSERPEPDTNKVVKNSQKRCQVAMAPSIQPHACTNT